jgi:hypothetical protein
VRHIRINPDDESGGIDWVPPVDLSLINRATLYVAGTAAQHLWKARPKHMAGAGHYADFLNLTKGFPDEKRDKLRLDAYERANRFLFANKAMVEAVAERLMERGQMDASEFMSLIRGA